MDYELHDFEFMVGTRVTSAQCLFCEATGTPVPWGQNFIDMPETPLPKEEYIMRAGVTRRHRFVCNTAVNMVKHTEDCALEKATIDAAEVEGVCCCERCRPF